MGFWRVRFTVRRLMVVVALSGVGLAAFRAHFSLGALAAGLSGLAFLRTCEKLEKSRSEGRPMGWSGVVETGIASALVAFAILGASFLPAIATLSVILPGYLHDLSPDLILRIAISSFVGLPIAVSLGRRIW